MSIEIAVSIHSWLFQDWLPLSYVHPTPDVLAGLGSKSALQAMFVKKIPSHRQVASKTRYMQDQDAHNCVYLSRSLTPHSLPTDVNVFFLAIISPALKLFNYSMKTLGICSTSSYYQCHFLFGLCSTKVLFLKNIILFWHSRFRMFCAVLLPVLCGCLDSGNPLD